MKCNSVLDEIIKYEELNKLEEMCAVHWAAGYAAAAVHASCGESTICRDGLVQIREILSDIENGKGRPEDPRLLEDLCQVIIADGDCPLSVKTADNILSTLHSFPEVFEEHCVRKICKMMICSGCYSLYIDPAVCDGCGRCLDYAASGAVSGGPGMIHVINDDAKLKNTDFPDSCPCGAIKKASTVKPALPSSPVPVGSFVTSGLRRKRKSRLEG